MNKVGFTLLELMIAMSIVFLVSVSLYAPYSHYQNKAHLKLGTKQIEQFLTQARNSAVYWTASGSNLSFGLYMNTGLETQVSLISYPFDIEKSEITRSHSTSVITNLVLEPWVIIDSVAWNDNILLFFEAVSWDVWLYTWNVDWIRETISDDILDINVSYKASSSSNLQNTMKYYTKTYVTDY